jgi:hypothetical protein
MQSLLRPSRQEAERLSDVSISVSRDVYDLPVDREEALTRLGLANGATREEIERAWRAEMKVVHPDIGLRPDDELAKGLNEARRIALTGVAEPASELVLR